MKKLLLISNSLCYGRGYLDHVEDAIKNFLGPIKNVLFFPYALRDWNGYLKTIKNRFLKFGVDVESIHNKKNKKEAVKNAKAIFIGGGNTFRLLKILQDQNLLGVIRERVLKGMPYMGSSAGANLACPTIMTTNDMPITEPNNFEALNLINFQINPHYIDKNDTSEHMGESREERIKEFLEENGKPVVGLKEGTWLTVEGKKVRLFGDKSAYIFRRDKKVEAKSGSEIGKLIR